jgi:hypothetical protein
MSCCFDTGLGNLWEVLMEGSHTVHFKMLLEVQAICAIDLHDGCEILFIMDVDKTAVA